MKPTMIPHRVNWQMHGQYLLGSDATFPQWYHDRIGLLVLLECMRSSMAGLFRGREQQDWLAPLLSHSAFLCVDRQRCVLTSNEHCSKYVSNEAKSTMRWAYNVCKMQKVPKFAVRSIPSSKILHMILTVYPNVSFVELTTRLNLLGATPDVVGCSTRNHILKRVIDFGWCWRWACQWSANSAGCSYSSL